MVEIKKIKWDNLNIKFSNYICVEISKDMLFQFIDYIRDYTFFVDDYSDRYEITIYFLNFEQLYDIKIIIEKFKEE